MANLQIIDPGRDLRKFPDTTNAGSVPVVDAPRLEPLFGSAGVFIHVGGPFQCAWIGLGCKALGLAVSPEPGKDLEGLDGKSARHLAAQMANVSTLVIIHIHLEAVSLIIAAEKDSGIRAPVRAHVDSQLEIVELFVAQEQTTVPLARRILLANEQAIPNKPMSASSMADSFWRFMPACERLTVEQLLRFRRGPRATRKRNPRKTARLQKRPPPDGAHSSTQFSFHGGRNGRVSNWVASASSRMRSVCTSHRILRPTNIAMRPR